MNAQLNDWRKLAANSLERLINGITAPTFIAQDGLVDDLIRVLNNQPPRPAGRDPYIGLFGADPLPELRRQAANSVKRFLSALNASTLVSADDLADKLIRSLRGFSTTRPTGVYPYEGLFGYTVDKPSPAQVDQWRQQAAQRISSLVSQIPDADPTPADDLADRLLRALSGQPARPPSRRPYEGLVLAPPNAPFRELRRLAANGLRVFVAQLSGPLGTKDAVIDDIIRQITTLRGIAQLPARPFNRRPYEGLFSSSGGGQLSANITLQDMTRSATADRLGIDNTPNSTEIANLRRLAQQILQPAWNALGPLTITSGFRSEALNQQVGGVPNSDHRLGYAADIVPNEVGTRRFAEWVVRNVPFDQVILEFGTDQNPAWIHVSAGPRNRREVLRQDENGTRPIRL